MTGQIFEQLQSKWFDESAPQNAKKATATLTFSGTVSDGQTVTIGSDVYEFDTAATSTITAGHIRINVNAAQTASAAVTALVAAITGNTSSKVTASDGTGDTVVVTAKALGPSGNDIAVSTDATNGTWGTDVTALSGGQWATPCKAVGTLVKDTTYYYVCTTEGNISDTVWKRFTLADY